MDFDRFDAVKTGAKKAARHVWAFIVSELKGLGGAFLKPFAKFTLLAGVLLLLVIAPRVFLAAPPAVHKGKTVQEPPAAAKALVAVGFSVFYAVHVGLVAGGLGALWRLVGGWIALPLLLVPAAVALSLWLFSGWLADEVTRVGQALAQSAQDKGLPTTEKYAAGILKGVHGGGVEALAVVGTLVLPFVLVDAVAILADPGFLWAFGRFVLILALVVLIGLAPSGLVSLVVLVKVFIKRMLGRYWEFLKGRKAIVI